MNYNKESLKSIYDFACGLVGKSLQEAATLPADVENVRNRGDLGSLVEKYYFGHVPPNTHEPDFVEVGLELKTTGLEKYQRRPKSGQIYRVKERLVLTTINFDSIREESWEKSVLLRKCKLLLILFYEYVREVPVVDRKFVLSPLLVHLPVSSSSSYENELRSISKNLVVISQEDMAQIRRDWEFIQRKIKNNQAHELSEGDTYYLGACRKGAGGVKENVKKQIGSEIGAMGRAFSLKQSFVRKLLEGHSLDEQSIGVSEVLTFEEATLHKFDDYFGLSLTDIESKINYSSKAKQKKNLYSKRILAENGGDATELVKAGIILKTVSLSSNGRAREDISFPAFNYLEVSKQAWEDSDFADQIEGRFLFIVFQIDEQGVDRLVKAFYWNMPFKDRLEAQKVWEKTKYSINVNARMLPRKSENAISHVRPHGTNRNDTELTPQGEYLVKKCFWLNGDYIANFVT